MMLKGKWRASKLMGLDVYNEANEKLGDVNELISPRGPQGERRGDRRRRLPGMPQHDIAVTMDKLKFVEEPVRTSAHHDKDARNHDRHRHRADQHHRDHDHANTAMPMTGRPIMP